MDTTKFKILLDEKYEWPAEYTFKFVVPAAKVHEFENLFSEFNSTRKESKTGKFISFTITSKMSNSDEVIQMYNRASIIEGIVSL